MTVYELARIAQRVGRNGRHALAVQLGGGFAGKDDFKAERREEGEPEREILVHIENARNTDTAAHCICKRFIVIEQTMIFVLIDIRSFCFLINLFADAAFAAVTRIIAVAVREYLHGNQTAVAAAVAAV